MPFSSDSGKAYLDRAITRLSKLNVFKNKTILDIGAGSGTYANRYSKTLLPRGDGAWEWIGVEIWEPYVAKYDLLNKYDNVFVKGVLPFLRDELDFERHSEDGSDDALYAITIFGDVLEHLTEDDAKVALEMALEASDVVIISLPIIHYPQGEYDGNPHEAHLKDDWSVEEALCKFPNVVAYGVENEIGVFILSRRRPELIRATLAPWVGVYMICKNESEFIGRALSSVDQARAIAVVDTGSTDGTVDLLVDYARSKASRFDESCLETQHMFNQIYDAKVIMELDQSVIIQRATVSPWRFDQARNVALSLLPADLDVVMSLDADEVAMPGWFETLFDAVQHDLNTKGRVSDRYHHRFTTVWNWREVEQGQPPSATEHWHERIHARHGYRWNLPVHEVLIKTGGPESVTWLRELWLKQMPDTSKSRSSYLPLLELSLKEDSTRWRSWSFYAGELNANRRYQDALIAIKKARDLPDADASYLHYQEHYTHLSMGNPQLATVSLLTAVALSGCREYRVRLAAHYESQGQLTDAAAALKLAAAVTHVSDGYVYDASVYGEEFDRRVAALNEKIAANK